MGQISPRIFECAVMRTPMVLFRGRYSDAIAPDEHYIPLELDFSNADQVLHRLDNIQSLAAMAERAYAHLVASGEFGYCANFGKLKGKFEATLARLNRQSVSTPLQPNKVASGRHAYKMQWPTDEPGGMDRFNASQLLANQGSAALLKMSTAMRNAMDAIEMLQRHKRSQTEEPAYGAGECPAGVSEMSALQAVAALQADFDRIMRDFDVVEQERARFDRTDAETKAQSASEEVRELGRVVVYEQEWIARFFQSYQRFLADYHRCRQLLQQAIVAAGGQEQTLRAKLRRQRNRVVIARAIITGSRHEFVKIAVLRVPYARDAALVAVRLLGRLQAK